MTNSRHVLFRSVLLNQSGSALLLLLVAWAWAMFPAAARAQQATASINGTIQDTSGAVIPGATITLTNSNTQVKQTTVSTDTGRYVFVSVMPGAYTLAVIKTGFAPVSQGAFTLYVNQTATFNVTLKVGTTTQTVTVEAAAAHINTSTSNLGTAITQTFVNDLPLNGRQFTQMLALTPGASPISVAQNSGGGQSNPLGFVVMPAINGQQNRSNYFMLDGVNDSEVVFSSYAVAPIIDDIQEFKVQSHNDEAQFGYVTGGIVNVVTKSGTNHFHGTLWEFLRNDALDARDPLLANRISLRQNQFGGSIGGPVRLPHYNGRNKTFFYFGYEGYRNVTGAGLSGLAIAPTNAELSGDLSSLPTQIYNPFSTRTVNGNAVRDPFMCDSGGNPLAVTNGFQPSGTPCNKIPQSLIDPNMLKYAQTLWPAAGPLILGQFNTSNPTKHNVDQNEYNVRLDESLNSSNSFWFRWSGEYQNQVNPGGFKGLNGIGSTDARNWGVHYLHTFSPTSILDATFGHVDLFNAQASAFAGINATAFDQQVNFAPSFACGFKAKGASVDCLVPSMSVAGFISGGEGSGGATPLTSIYEASSNFTKITGNHTLKTGFDLQWQGFFSLSVGSGAGFASAETADPQTPGTGSPLASFLLGVPDNASRRITVARISNQVTFGTYFEDQWKVTSRLTANMGLRWEVGYWPIYGTSADGTNAIGELDMNNGNYILQRTLPSCAQAGAAPCIPGGLPQPHIVVSPDGHLWDTPKNNFAPRVGLAYRLNNRTSLRSSFGIFYDEIAGINQTVQGIGGDWPSQTQVLGQNLNAATAGAPTVTAENPLATTVAALPPPTPFNQVEWYRDPKQKNAYSEQWNFGVQRQVGGNTVVEADYVGSHSSRLTVGTFGNVALTPGPGNPLDRAPYNYISPSFYDRSVGRGSYNSFQFSVNQHLSHGLQYLLSYTWSKSMDIGCSGYFSVEGCSEQNPWDLNNDRSVSGFDLTHDLSLSWVYQLPGLKVGNKFLNYAAGNWQLNGIFTATSGVPYDLGISGDIANTGNSGANGYGYERLNLVGNPNLSNPTPSQWFNPAAFAVPAPFTFGNLGRNALRADKYVNLDLSIFKEFPIRESKRLEFRADMFNLPNHTVWGIPVKDFNNPQFGQVLGTRSIEREIQFALKFYF
jgi:Carboxypeptidase regulatory-like domain